MTFIINPGFNNVHSKLLVFRNGHKISYDKTKFGRYEFVAEEGDRISIKFQYCNTTISTIADFTLHGMKDKFYIYPSKTLKIWELLCYKAFLCICLLYMVYKVAIVNSTIYNCFFTILIVILALSLVCLQFCMRSSFMLQKFYILELLQ